MSDTTWEIHEGVRCVECPGCGFTFDASHVDADTERFSCPVCGTAESEFTAALRAVA